LFTKETNPQNCLKLIASGDVGWDHARRTGRLREAPAEATRSFATDGKDRSRKL